MYLSDKGKDPVFFCSVACRLAKPSPAGEAFSVAFCAQTTGVDVVNSEAGIGWWTDNETAFLRRGFNSKGEHRFTPLFSLKQRAKQWWAPWRGEGEEQTDSSEEHV